MKKEKRVVLRLLGEATFIAEVCVVRGCECCAGMLFSLQGIRLARHLHPAGPHMEKNLYVLSTASTLEVLNRIISLTYVLHQPLSRHPTFLSHKKREVVFETSL